MEKVWMFSGRYQIVYPLTQRIASTTARRHLMALAGEVSKFNQRLLAITTVQRQQ